MIPAVELNSQAHAWRAPPVQDEASTRTAWIPRDALRAHGV